MQRMLFIARFEYIRYVTQRGFLIGTFLVPLLMVGVFIVVVVAMIMTDPVEEAIGYVDQAGVIRDEAIALQSDSNSFAAVPLHAYPNKASAHDAFVTGEVEAYIIIPPDYLNTGTATAYGKERISHAGEHSMRRLLRHSLLTDIAPETVHLISAPIANLTHRSLDESRSASQQNFLPFLLPFIFGMLFSSATLASSGYLLQAIIEEKENRTMEIIITSVTPEQLLGGKTLGLGALGLTRAIIWFLPGAGLSMAATRFIGTLPFSLPNNFILIAVPTFISGYLLYAGLMTTIGAMVTSIQEGQQMASFVSLFSAMPFMLNVVFLTDPNGSIAVWMSLFPLSAPLALIMRLPVAQVPTWQIILSLSLITISAILVVVAAARIFRVGMLQYGKAIKVREIPGILRESLRREHNEVRNPL